MAQLKQENVGLWHHRSARSLGHRWIPGALGPDAVRTTKWSSRSHGLAMNNRREVHGQICLRNVCRSNQIPRTQTDLKNVGSSKGQDLLVARVLPKTLDDRPKEKAWTGCKGLLLTMWPRTRVNWSHHIHMPVRQRALASHRPSTRATMPQPQPTVRRWWRRLRALWQDSEILVLELYICPQ